MTQARQNHQWPLPHQRLQAYQVARELVRRVGTLRLGDARLREQARKSAISVALNLAEGAGRTSLADKRRAYGIAFGELCEVAAALELSLDLRATSEAEARDSLLVVARLHAMLARLTRG